MMSVFTGVADILTTIAGDNQRTKVIEDSKQIVSNSLESLSNLSCTNDEGNISIHIASS